MPPLIELLTQYGLNEVTDGCVEAGGEKTLTKQEVTRSHDSVYLS